jgi:excisionase family DNA binding protein
MSEPTARLLYRPKEAAERLAMSERELWRKTKAGEIASIGKRRLRRYAEEDLRAYIRRNRNGGHDA